MQFKLIVKATAKKILRGLWPYEVFRGITPGKGRLQRFVKINDSKDNVFFRTMLFGKVKLVLEIILSLGFESYTFEIS